MGDFEALFQFLRKPTGYTPEIRNAYNNALKAYLRAARFRRTSRTQIVDDAYEIHEQVLRDAARPDDAGRLDVLRLQSALALTDLQVSHADKREPHVLQIDGIVGTLYLSDREIEFLEQELGAIYNIAESWARFPILCVRHARILESDELSRCEDVCIRAIQTGLRRAAKRLVMQGWKSINTPSLLQQLLDRGFVAALTRR